MDRPFPGLLFRYHRREVIQDLTREGKLWLGTLLGFRAMEGKMLADEMEGKLVLTEEIFRYTAKTPNAPLHRKVFGTPHPNAHIQNNTIKEHRETRDLWAFCVSRSLKRLAEVQEWTPTYDACAVIHRPEDFRDLIAAALSQLHRLRIVGIYPIVYRSREYEYAQHDGTDPALIKDAELFASQDEARFVFDPVERPIEAIRLHVPELVACCRVLQDEEMPK